MDDFGEQQALLTTELNSENTLRYRLPTRDEDSRSEDDSCQSDEWWSDSSSCSSCNSDVCSVADWQSEVNTLGELMYIESLAPQIDVNYSPSNTETLDGEECVSQVKSKKSTQNKLIRLIRRRNSGTRRSTRRKVLDVKDSTITDNRQVRSSNSVGPSSADSSNVSNSRVTFSDWPETELRTIQIRVFGENLGRRATLCESLLGLAITTFPDKLNIMIASIVPNTEAAKHHDIKTGDWLSSINGHLVTINNIDSILKTILPPVEVTLGLQRISSEGATDPTSSQVKRHQSELVRSILSSNNTLKLLESNKTCLFSIMYLTREGMNEDDDETSPDEGIIYCYPPSPDLNTLYKIRGAFITLHSLMKDATLSQHTPSEPISSTVCYNGSLIHVIYCSDDQELLLLCAPDDKCALKDAQKLTGEIVRCLKFKYQSLSRCFKFKEHIPLLEQFFSIILSRLYSPTSTADFQFEQLFSVAHWVPLPRDAQMQIDDALSELEANDFGSYINNNHGCQRLYSVIGTCLYYKGYLLSSHLARQDLVDVNSWCNQRGFLHLTRVENLANLVVWHEVYPASCNRGLLSASNTNAAGGLGTALSISNSTFPCPPNARWFLLIVGQGNSLLAVLLEAGGCSVEAVGVVGPDVFYVQQAQATLSHIHKIGVPTLADKWLYNGVRPQLVCPDYENYNKTSPKRLSTDNNCNISQQQAKDTSKSCENLQQSKLNLSSTGSNSKLTSASSLSSVAKHRNSPDNSINLITAQQTSLLHRTACPDEVSEDSTRSSIVSDEVIPILGRRAEREREKERAAAASDTNSHFRLSDSEFSDDSDWEPRRTLYGSRSLDMLMDLNKTRFSNTISVIPSSMLAGKQNSLFHYIQLDKLEGVLLSPPTVREPKSPLMSIVLDKFRSSAQSIHLLFKNTVKFKKLNAQEVHESLINKSLVAIKEYGMLFETELEQNKKSSVTGLNFWVIGRLLFTPHAKEVYVCFEESAPQNMVEIAFRLALSASG